MPESLEQFSQRTAFVRDSLPVSGCFVTNAGLNKKIDSDGRLLPFYGDTVIFQLSQSDLAWLKGIQQSLYDRCGTMLAEPLPPESFHITLHDLNNAPRQEEVANAMAQSGAASRELLATLDEVVIELRATAVFSMVNTSVVLGFAPVNDANCATLMTLYERFQQIVYLDYPLTPHVTLAYYRPGDYGEDGLHRLREAITAVNDHMTRRIVRLTDPRYCRFDDMSRFIEDM